MLTKMNENRKLRAGQLLFKVGGITIGFIFSLIATFRDLLSSIEFEQDNDRQLHDSGLSGELNHRTGRLDSGTDPYGWYDRD